MTRFPFIQVDAFTDQPLEGNPCAVIFNADILDDRTMLGIAREMNLSETAFVARSQSADFKVRFFTPAEEIPLAGHPTIATAYALVNTGRFQLSGPITKLTLELTVGPILVEIYAEQDKIDRFVMSQPEPTFLSKHNPQEIMPIFGLSNDDLLPNSIIQTVSTGTPQLMVPIKNLDALRRAQVDIPAYTQIRDSSDFFSPHLFCLQGVSSLGDTFARHFGVPPDTLEDPFTGSATGAMAAYLWRYGLIDEPHFTAEQGHWLGRPGQATVAILGTRKDIQTVKVAGKAVATLFGELSL